MPLESILDDYIDVLVLNPLLLGPLERVPGGEAAVDFAALHCEHALGRARIAGDDLELGAGKRIEEFRIAFGGRSCARPGYRCLVLPRILDRLRLRGLPGEMDFVDRGHPAEPGEFGRLVVCARRAECLLERERLRYH